MATARSLARLAEALAAPTVSTDGAAAPSGAGARALVDQARAELDGRDLPAARAEVEAVSRLVDDRDRTAAVVG